MRVIDGYHRVAAARRRGQTEIEARMVDGSWDSTFVIAVLENVAHGLPLSLADRRTAAERLLKMHGKLSDRALAEASGLSGKTIARIRRMSEEDPQSHTRIRRDGRIHHSEVAAGRQLAAELIAERPEASLRAIAADAGVSASTVRDVRARLRRGDDPVPAASKRGAPGAVERIPADASYASRSVVDPPADITSLLMLLSRDPALRLSAPGRHLLRWLHGHAVNSVDARVLESIPDHCVGHLVEFAQRCAINWAKIAEELTLRKTSEFTAAERQSDFTA